MEQIHKAISTVGQLVPPWAGVALGHFADNVTLQNIALVASIVYSVIGTWMHFRKTK